MPDFHEQLRGAGARPTCDVPLAVIERRLRSRRRSRIGAPLVIAAVLVLGLVAGASALTGDGDGARVTTMGPEVSAYHDVSVDLPDGWVSIQPYSIAEDIRNAADVLHATQLVAAGTAPVSSVDSCPTDQASTSDAFVSVSELDPGLTTDPTTEQPPGSRPADFSTAPVFSEGTCRDATNATTSQEYNYVFLEHGRALTARVVLGSTAPAIRRTEAYAILNSLRVGEAPKPAPTAASTIPPSHVPTTTIVPPSTVPPSDDEAAIRAAFLGWIDTKPPEDGAAYVEDGDAIREAIAAAARTNPQNARYTGRVDSVSVVSATGADVAYTLLVDRQPMMTRTGKAVKVDGVWKVSRETVCELLALAPGVHCPPRGG